MTFNLRSFGRDYRRQLLLCSIMSRLPLSVAYKVAGAVGRLTGPLRWQKDTYRDAMATSRMPVSDWDDLWRHRVDDHGAFCVNIFRHGAWDRAWFDRHVKMDVAGFEQVLALGKGCLFLTYHHAFHHTLCSLLGLAGFRVNALAAPEETSMIYDQVGSYIRRLHQGCAMHFNGGNYLFFNTPKQFIHLTNDALGSSSVLISLNDFSTSGKMVDGNICRLLGRAILAPSGSVRLAQRLGTPIVAGITIREGTTYRVVFRQLDSGLPHREVMQSYFDFLSELLAEQSYFWDGWNWFGDLPEVK